MSFTVPRDDLRAARGALDAARRRARHRGSSTDEAMGKVSIVGAGMKTPPRRRRQGVHDARRRRHQHRDDLDLADQDLLRRSAATACPTRCARCTPPSSSRATTRSGRAAVRACRALSLAPSCGSPSSAPPAPSAPIMLRALARARLRGRRARRRSPASARAGRELDGDDGRPAAHRRHVDGLRPRAVLAPAARPRASGRRASSTRGAVVRRQLLGCRMDADVPLVVAEVNPEAIDGAPQGIVANPNCTTMVVMLPAQGAARPLRPDARWWPRAFRPPAARARRASTSSPRRSDAVGGHRRARHDGASAAAEVKHSVHAETLAFNVVPLLGALGDERLHRRGDEAANESRKILGLPALRGDADLRPRAGVVGHAIAVRATFEREVDMAEALAALDGVPEPGSRGGADAAGGRRAATRRSSAAYAAISRTLTSINFFVVGDNLLKGAALNTVQLAELAIARGLVGARA